MNKIMKKKGKFRVEMQESNGEKRSMRKTERKRVRETAASGGEGRRTVSRLTARGMKRGGRTSTRGALLCDFRTKGANRRRENSATPFSCSASLVAAGSFSCSCRRREACSCAKTTVIERNRIDYVSSIL